MALRMFATSRDPTRARRASPFWKKGYNGKPRGSIYQLESIRDPEYLAINPVGKVPALIDGETIVHDSTVINEYLEDHGPIIFDSGLLFQIGRVSERFQSRR